ncbi:Short-chain dehydrogenase/reductase SDR [Pleurostoma richardsiae]|uniref:Short-chain dehydrogenase/reductase SDR n=1 Tax=Pleurostoma richardsiae TaxID=41990 RepID=A0AA38RED4_9PEZI|nr:Short-chain dehydrogenase/reductase SDR [Pleurostoma richardsiae]
MARALEANGAHVFILDMNADKLDEACNQSKFGRLVPIHCDITSKESLLSATERIRQSVGYVNLLVANAGVPGPYPPRISKGASLCEVVDAWWETSLESFLSTYRVNNAGTFYTVLAFLKLLDAGNKQKNVGFSSQIIMTASITAFNRQAPSGFAYATSKAAVIHMMKQLSTYLIPYKIRCNSIAPGLYPTDMSYPALEVDGESLLATIPAGRTGDAEDISGTILYLASRAGAYCNGMVVLTDGGRLCSMPATY